MVGTESSRSSKKATTLNAQSTHLDLKVIVAFLENILLITALTIFLCRKHGKQGGAVVYKFVTDNEAKPH